MRTAARRRWIGIASERPNLATGTDAEQAAAKDRIITITAAQQTISREQATQCFNEAIRTAKAAADKSAAASMGSFLGAVALLPGAIAAAPGASPSLSPAPASSAIGDGAPVDVSGTGPQVSSVNVW